MSRSTVVDLTTKLKYNKRAPFSKPETRIDDNNCLVVGGCILRDIKDTQFVNTIITSTQDGAVNHMKRAVRNIKDKHSNVKIAVAGE